MILSLVICIHMHANDEENEHLIFVPNDKKVRPNLIIETYLIQEMSVFCPAFPPSFYV